MTTPSIFKVLPLVAAGAALFASASTQAMTFALDDLANGAGYDFILADNGVGDLIGTTGTMAYFGSLGSWTNLAISISRQTGPDTPFLTLKYSANSTTAGQLAISVWDSYPDNSPRYLSSLGVTQRASDVGPVTATFSVYGLGTANATIGGTSLGSSIVSAIIGPLAGLDSSASNAFLSPTGPGVDLGINVVLTHRKAGDTGFTAVVTPTPVPIPAAAVLFGSALLGMVGIGRRKTEES